MTDYLNDPLSLYEDIDLIFIQGETEHTINIDQNSSFEILLPNSSSEDEIQNISVRGVPRDQNATSPGINLSFLPHPLRSSVTTRKKKIRSLKDKIMSLRSTHIIILQKSNLLLYLELVAFKKLNITNLKFLLVVQILVTLCSPTQDNNVQTVL